MTPDAQADLWRLDDFLAAKSPAAAERAISALQSAIASLDLMAERGRLSTSCPDVRELVIPFGSAAYVVEYRVEPERVLIARIFHSREAR